MAGVPKKKVSKTDPFKTKKTRTKSKVADDTVTPPKEVMQAIDQFRECQDQMKHFEGEATIHKNTILDYSQMEFAKRYFNGLRNTFKILGEETMVTYVVQDSSASLTEEEVDNFAQKWGEKAASELIDKDLRSIRFNESVLADNYDLVVQALNELPEEVLANLFKPMSFKAASTALEKAKKYAKKPGELVEMIHDLKLKNFIR